MNLVFFLKTIGSGQNMFKTKVVRKNAKAWFGGWGLRDRSRLCLESQKRVLSPFLGSFPLSNPKRSTIKAFLEVSFVSLALTVRTFFLFLKKGRQVGSTGLRRSSNLVHLDDKHLADFTWNLLQNLRNLVLFFLKTIGSGPRMVKTKAVRKKSQKASFGG